MQNRLTLSQGIMVVFGVALALISFAGCAKTDYSDTNAPEKPQAAGGNSQPHVPHGQGRHVGTTPLPTLPK